VTNRNDSALPEGSSPQARQPWRDDRWQAAVAHAERCRQTYERTLEEYFRGRCRAHAVLSARIAWIQAESRLVELRRGHRRPLEWT
jgi:hypothetical protein